jgi:hypothetical protein
MAPNRIGRASGSVSARQHLVLAARFSASRKSEYASRWEEIADVPQELGIPNLRGEPLAQGA